MNYIKKATLDSTHDLIFYTFLEEIVLTFFLLQSYEKTASEFFLTVKHYLRSTPATGVQAFSKWSQVNIDIKVDFSIIYIALHCTHMVMKYIECQNIPFKNS